MDSVEEMYIILRSVLCYSSCEQRQRRERVQVSMLLSLTREAAFLHSTDWSLVVEDSSGVLLGSTGQLMFIGEFLAVTTTDILVDSAVRVPI